MAQNTEPKEKSFTNDIRLFSPINVIAFIEKSGFKYYIPKHLAKVLETVDI